jgi:hypothetical protein
MVFILLEKRIFLFSINGSFSTNNNKELDYRNSLGWNGLSFSQEWFRRG